MTRPRAVLAAACRVASIVFLPKDGLLAEGDAWTPAATRPATPSPLWVNLHENIQRLGLGVQRIAPLHGTLQTIDDLRAAIAPR